MKNTWWLIYNDFSIFTEYFDIVDFIFKTFNEENIVCLKVPISSLKKDFDTYLSKTLFVPDCVLFWDKNWEIAKKFADLGIIVYNQPSQSILCENKIETYKNLKGTEDAVLQIVTLIGQITETVMEIEKYRHSKERIGFETKSQFIIEKINKCFSIIFEIAEKENYDMISEFFLMKEDSLKFLNQYKVGKYV